MSCDVVTMAQTKKKHSNSIFPFSPGAERKCKANIIVIQVNPQFILFKWHFDALCLVSTVHCLPILLFISSNSTIFAYELHSMIYNMILFEITLYMVNVCECIIYSQIVIRISHSPWSYLIRWYQNEIHCLSDFIVTSMKIRFKCPIWH